MELMQANTQWTNRPDDERYTSLLDMREHFHTVRHQSRETVVSSRSIELVPDADNKGMAIVGKAGVPYAPSHWAFGQLATLAGAPAGYLRDLPSPIAADCVNYGLKFSRDVADVGLLLQSNGTRSLRAATGPRYGRIWNSEILDTLVNRFGDGVSGTGFRVPGEFGRDVTVTKENTTLYASDRDMFVFLADEQNRIEIPNRRDGESGSMARGFFVWNSEVGDKTLGIASFLFDYVCSNRIVWGAAEFKQVTIRHSAGAPDRWIEDVMPAIKSYASGTSGNVVAAIEDARSHRLDNVDEWLAGRFGKRIGQRVAMAHMTEEGRPIETRWDAITGATAYAKSIGQTDNRVAFERQAGDLLTIDV